MQPSHLTFTSIATGPVRAAEPVRAMDLAEQQSLFASIYSHALETEEEAISQLGSADAPEEPSPAEDALSLLQLRAAWSSGMGGAAGALNVRGGSNDRVAGIDTAQSGTPSGNDSAEAGQGQLPPTTGVSQLNPAGQSEGIHAGLGIGRVIAWLDSHAHLHSIRRCAAAVRQAMEAAGIQTADRPLSGDAGDYGPFLLRHGARVVQPESYEPHAGDIAVFDKSDDHRAGHIQVFDGEHWVSDFVQHSFSPYREQASTPPAKVYRMS